MKKNISSTRFSKKVSYTDVKPHYDITVTGFEYIQLQMISDAFDMKFDHVVTVILGLGIERFQEEFNCSFGTERMDA